MLFKDTLFSDLYPRIFETISQIKSSDLTVDDIKELTQKSDGALKSKLQDILFLYQQYQDVLNNGLLDDCDRLKKLGELAKNSDFIKQSEIFVVGFDNVTCLISNSFVFGPVVIHPDFIALITLFISNSVISGGENGILLFTAFISISYTLR